MADLSRIDTERAPLVEPIVRAMYARLVKKVIADIKAMPESCRQSGDADLADVWEEFKYQVQREQSGMFEVYEEVIIDLCARHVSALDQEEQHLLWLWSEGYLKT